MSNYYPYPPANPTNSYGQGSSGAPPASQHAYAPQQTPGYQSQSSLPPPPSFLPPPPMTSAPSYDQGNNAYRPYESAPPGPPPPLRYEYQAPESGYGNGRGDGPPRGREDGRRGRGGGRGGGGGRRDGGDRRRSPDGRRDGGRLGQRDHKSEQGRKESKCRTLFVRNVSYEANVEWLRQSFSAYGEVKEFFEIITKRGLIFITYFDLRAAEKAREGMHGTQVEGRPIDVHYSLPRDDDVHGPCGRDKNQGSVLVTVRENAQLNEMELGRMCEQYGEVRSVHRARNPGAKVVEFWDSRGATLFYDQMEGRPHQGGPLQLRFLWDEQELDDVLGGFSPPKGGRRDGRDAAPAPMQRYQPPQVKYETHTNRYDAPPQDRRDSYGRDNGRNGYSSGPPPPGPPPNRYQESAPMAAPASAGDPRLEQAQRIQQLLGSLGGSGPSAPPPNGNHPPPNYGAPPQNNNSYPPASSYRPPPSQNGPGGPPSSGPYAPPAQSYGYDPRPNVNASGNHPPGPGSGPSDPRMNQAPLPPLPHINPNGPGGGYSQHQQAYRPPPPLQGQGPGQGPPPAQTYGYGTPGGQGGQGGQSGMQRPPIHIGGGGPPPPHQQQQQQPYQQQQQQQPPQNQGAGAPPPPMNDVSSLLAMLKK